MKEITILSGKGGAGKTSITAALSAVAENSVFCDTDVDAADLHLILTPEISEEHVFYGSLTASIDENKCTNCGICKKYCRFDAIHYKTGGGFEINPFQCEGCRLCERICPAQAISSDYNSNNYWYVSDTRFGKMVHAKMGPGEENSGKLVTRVRKRAKEIAREINADYIISDGPPGIGCPVISSVTGSDAVLVVIEPSNSGLHDARRLIELVHSFGIKLFAIINKHDLSPETTHRIKDYLKNTGIPLLAELPFNREMTEAMVNKKTIVEYNPGSDIAKKISSVWQQLKK